MRKLQKILVALALASILSLSVIWGTHNTNIQKAANAVAEDIQKPGHLALADVINIQKPGH